MDPVFHLLAGYQNLPEGWGFPPIPQLPPEPPKAAALREALFPISGDEGRAQLVRWYYGIIRAYPQIALGIGLGNEVYDPGMAWKPMIELATSEVYLTPSPATGTLSMGWSPATGELVGTIVVDGPDLSLNLNGETYALPYTVAPNGVCDVSWPEELKTVAAFTSVPTTGFTIVFRPQAFNAQALVDRVAPLIKAPDLIDVGLTDEWSFSSPEAKLAIAWAVVQNSRNID